MTVKLVKYADDSKIKLIKEIKAITEGMNLVQVHAYVAWLVCITLCEVLVQGLLDSLLLKPSVSSTHCN